jgi:hypothetical protein
LLRAILYVWERAPTKGERAMSEAAAGGRARARAKLERRLIQRSLQDEDFRQQLLSEPKAIIERAIGTQLPERVRVVALEESTDTIYLVLPSASPLVGEGGELSDELLESVSGAGWGGAAVIRWTPAHVKVGDPGVELPLERTSQNAVKAKFAEFTFLALR